MSIPGEEHHPYAVPQPGELLDYPAMRARLQQGAITQWPFADLSLDWRRIYAQGSNEPLTIEPSRTITALSTVAVAGDTIILESAGANKHRQPFRLHVSTPDGQGRLWNQLQGVTLETDLRVEQPLIPEALMKRERSTLPAYFSYGALNSLTPANPTS
ncbi:MAG TPA: hypothetical protein VJ836_02445 [Candidatus Saccharimonadales bacterium]|nr:hypothetical protein [Candidatus Saccharimonadales bacterium]